MSATTATLLAGSFAALLGVVVERLLRLTGLLRFEASEPSLMLTGVLDKEGLPRNVNWKVADETTEADGVEYRFAIDLFNGKEVPTGLRDVTVVFVHNDGHRQRSSPYDSETGRQVSGRLIADQLVVINVSPRQFVRKELHGYFGKEEADAVKTGRWERTLVFEAKRPKRPILGILGSKTYHKTIKFEP